MKELKKDVKIIRESQIRMEADLQYHIKRTDILEDRLEVIETDIKPLYVVHFFKDNYKFITFIVSGTAACIFFYLKSKGM
tara:strand:+ start:2553 stop:2792 length:240 start_codon:yes stop_codon:yes gene_type:complete